MIFITQTRGLTVIKARAITLLRSSRLPFIALLAITGLAALLRAYHLAFKPLWYDEATIFWIAQRDLPNLISQNAVENSAPPLFALLTSLVARLSTYETALRVIPWLAGTLTVPAMYLFARRVLSEGGALAAAFIAAIAPTQIQYSQQLREYSLSVLLSLFILIAYSIFLEKRSWRSAGLLASVTAVGIFTQYGLALVVMATNLLFLAELARMRKEARQATAIKWVVVQVIALASALGVFFLGLNQQVEPGGFASSGHLSSAYWTGTSLKSAAEFVYSGARDLIAFTFPGYVFTLLLYAGALLLVAVHLRSSLPFIVAAPTVVLVAASLLRLYPLVGGRQDIFVTPLIILVAATTFDYLAHIESRPLLYALFIALIAWRAIPSLSSYYQTDGEGAVGKLVERVASEALPGDPIYVCLGGDPTVRYYINVRYPMPRNPLIEGIRGPGPRDYLDQVDAMLATYHRAWIITFRSCGDVTPLIDHLGREWSVELVEKRYPEAQLFFVH